MPKKKVTIENLAKTIDELVITVKDGFDEISEKLIKLGWAAKESAKSGGYCFSKAAPVKKYQHINTKNSAYQPNFFIEVFVIFVPVTH